MLSPDFLEKAPVECEVDPQDLGVRMAISKEEIRDYPQLEKVVLTQMAESLGKTLYDSHYLITDKQEIETVQGTQVILKLRTKFKLERQGHWVRGSSWSEGVLCWYYNCPECAYEVKSCGPLADLRFCPRCGSRMRGEVNHEQENKG